MGMIESSRDIYTYSVVQFHPRTMPDIQKSKKKPRIEEEAFYGQWIYSIATGRRKTNSSLE